VFGENAAFEKKVLNFINEVNGFFSQLKKKTTFDFYI
tara:strand:+ start:1844 stop:1954 length:111 start_codon:yes stop_codon:yes gene_type:complete